MKSNITPPTTPQTTDEKIDRLADLIAEFREIVDIRFEEMSDRLDAAEAHSDTRFKEAEARSDTRFKEAEARSDTRFKEAEARSDTRFKEAEARSDARFNEIQLGMKEFRNKITDIETAQYGIRAMHGGYIPQRERLEAPGGAAIEPIQAWRRKLG